MTRRTINDELEEIEATLQALTLRVSELRGSSDPPRPSDHHRDHQVPTTPTVAPPTPRAIGLLSPRSVVRAPAIGDSVTLRILGTGIVRGTVIGITAQRVRISVPGRAPLYRAFHNVTILQNVGRNEPDAQSDSAGNQQPADDAQPDAATLRRSGRT
jgi:hypothetical protein